MQKKQHVTKTLQDSKSCTIHEQKIQLYEVPLRQLQMRCYNRNPLLTSFHSCKRVGRQHRNCCVANMLPKQLEKRSCCCDIFFNVVSMLLFSNKKTVSSAQCCHRNSGGEVLAKKAIVSSEN